MDSLGGFNNTSYGVFGAKEDSKGLFHNFGINGFSLLQKLNFHALCPQNFKRKHLYPPRKLLINHFFQVRYILN